MQRGNWAFRALANYCDLIAEYNREEQRFFIHHDASAPEDEGRWLPVEKVRLRFRGAYATDMHGARVTESYIREQFEQGQDSMISSSVFAAANGSSGGMPSTWSAAAGRCC